MNDQRESNPVTSLTVPNEDRRMRVRRQQLDGIGSALRTHALQQLQVSTTLAEQDETDTQTTAAVVDAFVSRVMARVEANTVVEDDQVPGHVEPYDFALAEELRTARAEYEELVGSVGQLRRAEMSGNNNRL